MRELEKENEKVKKRSIRTDQVLTKEKEDLTRVMDELQKKVNSAGAVSQIELEKVRVEKTSSKTS